MGKVSALEAMVRSVDVNAQHRVVELGSVLELEEKTRHEADKQLLAALQDVQSELRTEANRRSSTDSRLAASVEQLRSLVSTVVEMIESQRRSSDTLTFEGFAENSN